MTPYSTEPRHSRTAMLKSVGLGLSVFLLGSALEELLTLYNIHGFVAFADDVAAGIVVGLMVLLYERRRQREIDTKLRTIRLMNHHVRNALQVISAVASSVDASEQPTKVQDAVRRIEWALREVLPGETEANDASPNPGTAKREPAA